MTAQPSAILRRFGRRPMWTLTVLLVLALGTGTTFAGWVLVDAVLLRPLGVVDEEQLVRIGGTGADRTWMNSNSWPAVEAYRARSEVFSDVAAEGWPDPLHWRVPGEGQRIKLDGRAVTGNYFEVLGVRAVLGRTLTRSDDHAAAAPVVVASHRFWQRHLGGRSDVLGEQLRINATDHTLVGVLGEEFVGMDLAPLDVWIPARPNLGPAEIWSSTEWNMFEVFGRLRPGATLAQANTAGDAAAQAVGGWGGGNTHSVAVPVSRLGNSYRDAGAVQGASLLGIGILAVLLLTSVNVGGLLLVRAERRRHELALRRCMGASRLRLLGEECFGTGVLVAVGTIVGIVLALALIRLAIAFAGAPGVLGLPDLQPPSPLRVGVAVLGVGMVVALIGMLPLTGATRSQAQLRSGLKAARAGRGWLAGRSLVVAQFALSIVVVGAAFAFVAAYADLWNSKVGVMNSGALVMRLDYSVDDVAAIRERNRAVLSALEADPAVFEAAIAPMVPVSGGSMTIAPTLPHLMDPQAARGFYNPVSDGFFNALGIPLRAGRAFAPSDVGGPPVVIVSAAAAERLWPGRSPLGQTVRLFEDSPLATVVGVAADVRYQSLDEPLRNTWYVPLAQMHMGGFFHAVAVPRPGQADAAAAALRQAATRVEPDRAPGAIETIEQRIDRAIAGPRFVATLTASFGALALLLAAVGSYGAFAYLVSARQRELGLRSAMGASPRKLFGLILGDAARLLGIGMLLALLGGAATLRVLAAVFHELPSLSPVLVAMAGATVAAVALLAASRPAAEAASVDPADSLRGD